MQPLETASDTAREQLIDLLDGRLAHADVADCARILAAITRLFLTQDHPSAQTLSLFDRIFVRLAVRLPVEPLAALSEALASISHAPKEIVTFLAHHQSTAVAAPLLSFSPGLSLAELAGIVSRGDEGHLLAVSSRSRIDARLASILVGRNLQRVIDRLLINPGVQFLRNDFCAALPRATADSRGRVPLHQPAAILDSSGRPIGHCATLDISPGGIKLQTGSGTPLVETLTIELPSIERTRLRGRIAWRQMSIAGMQFSTPLAEQLAIEPDRH
jgi:hypothetical protein